MRLHTSLLPIILGCLPCAAIPYPALAGTAHVGVVEETQIVSVDPVVIPKGGKDSPVMRITFPAKGNRLPVVILSHGNRLSRADYQPLVTTIARAGYVVIQPDHPDSSDNGFARQEPQPDDTWRIRVDQLRWIAMHVGRIAQETPALRGRLDAGRMALIGHSFGGHSVALAMGAKVMGQSDLAPIKGIRAAIMLAPPGGYEGLTEDWKTRAGYLRTAWNTMSGPALVINGGADMTPLTGQGPKWHDDVFNSASAGQNICLMVVEGAGHYLGGIDSVLRPPAGDATPERRQSVLSTVISFLNSRMRNSAADAALWAERRKALACK